VSENTGIDNTPDTAKLISIVTPVFNEEESIPIFYARLQEAIAPLRQHYGFEILFTNNRSHDRTLEVILGLRASDSSVQVLTLSRNFGYQPSLMSGIRHASGDAIVVIDVDCEDPPELIPRFIEEWEHGFDLVYGDRKKRTEFFAVQLARLAFYRLNRLLADTEIVLDMGDFASLSRRLRDLMLAYHSTFPFLRTEAAYVGFERKGIAYKRQARVRGKSHYNFVAMVKFAVGGILSSSTFPLRVVAFLFIPVLVTTLVLLSLDLFNGLSQAFHVLVTLDLSYVMFSVACLSVYLARDYKNGVSRPVFVVDWETSAVNGDRFRWTTDHVRE
jgi:polyisoprenyl-phosphate glycosyltransferase